MSDPLERTFLSAAWRNLVAFSYEADPALLRPLVPPGLELDLFEGRAYVSLVGFLFLESRAMGVRLPFCQRFEEVNLRFYVRRRGPEGVRHGVVFVKELVPCWPITLGARWLFGEPYRTVPMRSRLETDDGGNPRPGGLLEYAWRSGGRSHRIAARAPPPLGAHHPPEGGSARVPRAAARLAPLCRGRPRARGRYARALWSRLRPDAGRPARIGADRGRLGRDGLVRRSNRECVVFP
jgi:hypothetical protein